MHVRGAVMGVDDLRPPVVMVGESIVGRDGENATHRVAQAQRAEHHQHHRHEQLEAGRHADRHAAAERHDERAGDRQREGVPDAPQEPDARAGREAALARDDRRHRHHVIGIGRMLKPEREAEQNRRDDGIHGHSDILRRSPERRALRTAATSAQWDRPTYTRASVSPWRSGCANSAGKP